MLFILFESRENIFYILLSVAVLNCGAPGLRGRDESQVLHVSNWTVGKEWRKTPAVFLLFSSPRRS